MVICRIKDLKNRCVLSTSAILWSAYGDKLIPKDDIDFIGTTQIALDILEYPFEMLDLFIELSLPPYDKDKNVNLRLYHVDGLEEILYF